MAWHSVSQLPLGLKFFAGSDVVDKWGTAGQLELFSKDRFKSLFGRGFNAGKDVVLVMNADYAANGDYFSTAIYDNNYDSIWVKSWSGSGSGKVRINYLVVLDS